MPTTFDAKADTAAPAGTLAASDKIVFGDVSADAWDTSLASVWLAELLRVSGNKIIVPNSAHSGTGYAVYRADGTTPMTAMTLDASNNLKIDLDNTCGYVGIGGSGQANHGASILLVHNQGTAAFGMMTSWETYDGSQDAPIVSADGSNNLLFGNDGVNFSGSTQSNNSYFGVQSGKVFYFQEAGVNVAKLASRVLGVSIGTSQGSVFANVGGAIFNDYVTIPTTHTDGTEDDLNSHTVLANTLANNGDSVETEVALSTAAHATATRQYRRYFAGTKTFDSGSVTTAAATTGRLRERIVRESATVVRVISEILPSSLGAPQYTRITGLTLSANNVLKGTGTAAGTGAAAGDISELLTKTTYTPAATVLTVPASLLPVAWFDATTGTYQTSGGTPASANNDPVGSWVDQSFAGRGLSQATTTKRPLLKTAYQNGLPAVLFDGVDDFFTKTFTLAQPCSCYMVAKVVTTINNACLLGVNNDYWVFLGAGGTVVTEFLGTVASGPTQTTGTPYTFKILANGAAGKLSLNAGAETTVNSGVAAPGGFGLGATGAGNNPANIAIMEAVFFDRVLTSGEETSLFSYLRTKWNHY